ELVLRLAEQRNLGFRGLADRLKQLAGSQVQFVQGIMDEVAGATDDLLREVGPRPELVQGKAALLVQFAELHMEAANTRKSLDAARSAEQLFQGLLAANPAADAATRYRWQVGVAQARYFAGSAHFGRAERAEGLEAFTRCRALMQELMDQHPDDPERKLDLS